MRDILLIAIVAVCSVIALRRPVFGLLTFVCLGLLNPQSLAWTFGQTFRFSLVVGICTIVGYLFSTEPRRFPRQGELVLLVMLWGMFGISSIFAIYPVKAMERFIYISKILVMVLLATSLINTEKRLRLFLQVVALSLGFYAVKGGLFSIVTAGRYVVFGPDNSFLSAENSIGLALAMNVPLLFLLSRDEQRPIVRRTMKGMLFFSYPAVICTFSRGAWIGLAIGTAMIVAKSKRRYFVVISGLILGLVLWSFLPQVLPERVSSRYEQLVNYGEDESAMSRLWNWEYCKRVGLDRPLVGGGFDFYSLETLGKYYPEFLERWPGKVWSCHSIWLTMLGEHGIPGLILWITLIGFCFMSLRRLISYEKGHEGPVWIAESARMVQAAVVTYMVVGTFLDAAYFDLFYYLVGVVIILKEQMRPISAGESATVAVGQLENQSIFSGGKALNR